jgi:8-oxo-dGTP diphosphatase
MTLSERFPLLHLPDRWDWASITMQFQRQLPADRLVSSTHAVAFVGEQVILCRDERPEIWFLPGGTREPDESVPDSLVRELFEEAGARLIGDFHPIGAHVGVSDADRPYRPHLPHPEKAWLWGWADAEIVGPPSLPDDGERIDEVRLFPLQEAARSAVADALWLGELIMFAAECREHTRSSSPSRD